jgi:large subunit ribosomal protein L23
MNQERLYKVLVAPHISEKATNLAQIQQVVFKVLPDATKPEIASAVETRFKVKVASVTTCNVKGKRRNFRQIKGQRKSWKKAYVSLCEGHTIDFMSSTGQ